MASPPSRASSRCRYPDMRINIDRAEARNHRRAGQIVDRSGQPTPGDALLPGWRPAPEPFFTAVVTLQPRGAGTLYTATAIHRDPEGRKRHEEMGFHDGWGLVLDQLVAFAKTL